MDGDASQWAVGRGRAGGSAPPGLDGQEGQDATAPLWPTHTQGAPTDPRAQGGGAWAHWAVGRLEVGKGLAALRAAGLTVPELPLNRLERPRPSPASDDDRLPELARFCSQWGF